MKLACLIERNLRILMRSKATLVVILAVPLLAVLLASVSFDNDNQYALKLAVFGQYVPRIANQFLVDLRKNGFQVDKVASADACQSLVKEGKYHACLLINADSKNQVSMTMLVDYAKIQVVDYLLSKVSDRISMQSSQVSLNMTEAILSRIESSRDEVNKNRFIITALTTGQEQVGRQLDELGARLAGIDPKVDMDAPQKLADNLESSKALTHLDSVQQLKNDLISSISDFSNTIEAVLKDSAMSESEKNAIRLIISTNDGKVKKISDEFRVTEKLSQNDVEGLHSQLKNVVASLSALQSQLDAAQDARFEANVQIRKLKGTLQDNLLKIVVLQSALNKIGSSVDTLKVSRDDVLHPFKTDIRPIAASQSRLRAIFPTVLVFMIMISGTLLAASMVAFHRQNPGSLRDSLMPVHTAIRMLAMFATVGVLLAGQAILGLGLAVAMLGFNVVPGIPSASLALFGIITVFSLLGMVLGFFFATEQAAVIAGVAITTGALILSDALLPLESMPRVVAIIANLNPFVLGSEAVRRALLYNTSVLFALPRFFLLLLYGMILALILAFVQKDRF